MYIHTYIVCFEGEKKAQKFSPPAAGETPHPTKREGYCLPVAGVVQGLPPYGVPASLIPAGSSERLPPPVLDALAGIFEVGC